MGNIQRDDVLRIAVALEEIVKHQNANKRLLKQLIRNTGGFGNKHGQDDIGLEQV